MKKPICIATLLVAGLLAGCNTKVDSDGVPRVDDPHHPVDADGKPMKGLDFVQKYCLGKGTNATCDAVHIAVSQDSSKGGLPKGW
jgi:hypothetical protein